MTKNQTLFFGCLYLVLAGFFVAVGWQGFGSTPLFSWVDLAIAALYVRLSRRMFSQYYAYET